MPGLSGSKMVFISLTFNFLSLCPSVFSISFEYYYVVLQHFYTHNLKHSSRCHYVMDEKKKKYPMTDPKSLSR
jgi:hypothetical protein